MNINTNVYKHYVKSGSTRKLPNLFYSGAEKVSAAKKDTFSLSSSASSNASMFRECSHAIKNAVNEVTAPAAEERIDSLKKQITSGAYNVSSGQIADAILGRIM